MENPDNDSTAYIGQAEEIADLKTSCSGCRVIKDVGEFKYVVNIKSDSMEFSIKFQIEDSYPSTVPSIIIKAPHLSDEQKALLLSYLQLEALNLLNKSMMMLLYKMGVQWVEENRVLLPQNLYIQPKTKKKIETKSGKKKKQNNEASEVSKKLVSMKTATDVVSRIIWDEQLPQEYFAVGYLDRFVGIVERSFSTFTWEDLASVDYDALAIPKHRIHYFKYKNIKVWDKDSRLDNVFGSTGSGLTIIDVIEKYELGELVDEGGPGQQPEHGSDDSEDEDIVINTGMQDSSEDGFQYPRDKYWGPKKRPTHFLCLRITNPAIVEVVKKIRGIILDIEPSYEENIMPADRLHITLCCVGLDSYEDINNAVEVLHKIKPQLDEMKPKNISVNISGVNNFFHQVLYAEVKHNAEFLGFVRTLTLLIQEAGIEIRDVFEFTPHMTLLKFKRQLQKEMKTRYLEPRLYEALGNEEFGFQEFDNVYLCKMSEDRDEAGFYITPTSMQF